MLPCRDSPGRPDWFGAGGRRADAGGRTGPGKCVQEEVLVRWRQDLQVKLRNRYRALYTADSHRIAREIDLVVGWISGQPALAYILEEAQQAETAPSYDEWRSNFAHRGLWEWPTKTEAGRAVFVWDLLRHISVSDQEIIQFLSALSSETNFDAMSRDFTEQVVRPLFDYLDERIGDGSSVLYVLERYVRQIEWFDQRRLYDEFRVNTRQG